MASEQWQAFLEQTAELENLEAGPPEIAAALAGWTREIPEMIELRAREIARDEIASLAGLALRRVQESKAALETETGPLEIEDGTFSLLGSIFGEALHDFSGTEHAPGDQILELEDGDS